jgi:cytoskeletal protein RodZ
MDQQPIDNQAQPPIAPVIESQQPPKKSSKKRFIVIIILLVIILSVAGYLAYGYYSPATETTDTDQTSTETDQSTTLTIEDLTNLLTLSATSESKLTDTDDSSIAEDASNAASNVGDSIDENSL